MTKAIEVRRIRVEFPGPSGSVVAVHDVSMSVAPSEFVCILGPSGCGKTTILNCLAGFIEPTSGDIFIDANPVSARGIDRGVVFQDLSQLFPWRTAQRNIEYGLEVRKVPASQRRARAAELLKLVTLEKFAGAYPHELSGGMQQRVAIARALAYDPGVLLMDEPFAALDAMTRDTLQHQLTDIWSTTKKTVVYITHNVGEAVFLGDQIIIMGEQGTVKTILRNEIDRPRDPLSSEFVELQREVLSHLTH